MKNTDLKKDKLQLNKVIEELERKRKLEVKGLLNK
jgi:hypothetical protein